MCRDPVQDVLKTRQWLDCCQAQMASHHGNGNAVSGAFANYLKYSKSGRYRNKVHLEWHEQLLLAKA